MRTVRGPTWDVQVRVGLATEAVFVSYPRTDIGYDLLQCIECGQVYAVEIGYETYIGPPRMQRLRGAMCVACGAELSTSVVEYPMTFLCKDGTVGHMVKSSIAPTTDPVFRELPSIYPISNGAVP